MARNRRSDNSDASHLAPALMALLACAFFVSTGVGYVWYTQQNADLGRTIVKLENELTNLKTQNAMRKDRYESMISPVELNTRVETVLNQKMNMGLGPPAQNQIIRIAEPPMSRMPTQRPAVQGGSQPEKP